MVEVAVLELFIFCATIEKRGRSQMKKISLSLGIKTSQKLPVSHLTLGVLLGTLMHAAFCLAEGRGTLIQNKYFGVHDGPAEQVTVDGAAVVLVPLVNPLKSNSKVKASAPELPHVIVPDESYVSELSAHKGHQGKPENFVTIQDRPSIVLKASEVRFKDAKSGKINYFRVTGKPANHLMVDGVETVLVNRDEYVKFLRAHVGVEGLPANYVVENNETVQVIPVDPSDYPTLFAAGVKKSKKTDRDTEASERDRKWLKENSGIGNKGTKAFGDTTPSMASPPFGGQKPRNVGNDVGPATGRGPRKENAAGGIPQ